LEAIMARRRPKVRVFLEPSVTEREEGFYPAYRARVELRDYTPQEERHVYVTEAYNSPGQALSMARQLLPDARQYVQKLWELELENGSLRAGNYGPKIGIVKIPLNASRTSQEPF
jgi:hypothetical protein